MPLTCHEQWTAYTAICDRLDAATAAAAEAMSDARTADRAAALAAAAAGKPTPKPTEADAEAAYLDARRTVDALTTLAADAEREWLTAAEEHRDVWHAAAATRVETAVRTVVADLDAPRSGVGRTGRHRSGAPLAHPLPGAPETRGVPARHVCRRCHPAPGQESLQHGPWLIPRCFRSERRRSLGVELPESLVPLCSAGEAVTGRDPIVGRAGVR